MIRVSGFKKRFLLSSLLMMNTLCHSAFATEGRLFFRQESSWIELEEASEKTEQSKPDVVIIHGQSITTGGRSQKGREALDEFSVVADVLEASGRYGKVLGYGYNPDLNLADLGKDFSEKLKSCGETEIVAYSLGGLVARFALEQHQGESRALVTLGTPHLGIEAGQDIRDLLSAGPFLAIMNPGLAPLLPSLMAMQQLFSDSPVMQSLNSGEVRLDTAYHLIQGAIKEPVPELPFSGFLMDTVYKGQATDGVVPVYEESALSKVMPLATMETFEGMHHNSFKSRSFAGKLVSVLKKIRPEAEKPQVAEESGNQAPAPESESGA